MANEDKNEKVETRGRKKIHEDDNARWQAHQDALKCLGYVTIRVEILKDRRADLAAMTKEAEKPRRFLVETMIEFMRDNKHLFPGVFGKKEK